VDETDRGNKLPDILSDFLRRSVIVRCLLVLAIERISRRMKTKKPRGLADILSWNSKMLQNNLMMV